jgi:hypothetical protein
LHDLQLAYQVVQAHTHARNATLETRRQNPVAASEEHDLAAAEFAAAAQATSDSEALRILNLLEQHHKRLGQILKTPPEKHAVRESVSQPTAGEDGNAAPTAALLNAPISSSQETTTHPPRLPRPLRSSTRELSSSIASNLASARGIPSNRQKRPTPISPLVSAQNADGQIAQDDIRGKTQSRQNIDATDALLSRSRQLQSRPSWSPPVSSTGNAETTEKPAEQGADAHFQQFYATFESLMSKLSAPLAFAGLPLTTPSSSKPSSNVGEASPKALTQPERSRPAPPSVDYSQLISRAALRAVSGGNPSNPSESFYVVPTTGGTISYAEIMSRAEREEARAGFRSHSRQTSNLTNISEDDFVDARSTILPSQPSRFARSRGAEEVKVNGKTMEELALENQALKHLSDTLSKRLHVFEMSAQTSSAALAQSIRSLHNRSPMLSPQNSRGKPISGKSIFGLDNPNAGADEATQRRITELEEILRKSDAKARKKDEENAKLKETIVKYRDKWDSLKAGAKARREREKERERRGSGGGGAAPRPGVDRTLTEEIVEDDSAI